MAQKTFKELLKSLGACQDAVIWAGDMTIEQVVKDCHRGDWLLWLAFKININNRKLTLTKGHCVNAAYAAYDAAHAAYAAAYAAAAYAAADADAAARAAKKQNQMQTADICREHIGELIINRVNELLNK